MHAAPRLLPARHKREAFSHDVVEFCTPSPAKPVTTKFVRRKHQYIAAQPTNTYVALQHRLGALGMGKWDDADS